LTHSDSSMSDYDINMGAYAFDTSVNSSSRGNGGGGDAREQSGSDSGSDDAGDRRASLSDAFKFDETNGGDEIDDQFMRQQYPSNLNQSHSPSSRHDPFDRTSYKAPDAFNFDQGESDQPFFPANKAKSDAREKQDREELAALRAKARPRAPSYAKGTPRSVQSTPRMDGAESIGSARQQQRDMHNKESRSMHRSDGNANTFAMLNPNATSQRQPFSEQNSARSGSNSKLEDSFMQAQYETPPLSSEQARGVERERSSKVDNDMYRLKADLYKLRQDDDEAEFPSHEAPYESRFNVQEQAPYATPQPTQQMQEEWEQQQDQDEGDVEGEEEMEEWQKVYDESYQMYYYFNNFSGESTWDIPASFRDAEGWGGDSNNVMASALEIIHTARSGRNTARSNASFTSRPPTSRPTKEQRDSVLSTLTGQQQPQADPHPDYNATLNSRVVGSPYVPPQKNDQSDSDSEGDGDDQEQKGIAKGAHTLTDAYGGIYDVSELLEDEEARSTRKFNKMKEAGSIMRTRMGWEEWLSSQGAVFYAQRGRSGGQWEVPQPFARLEQEKQVVEKNKSRLKRQQYQKEEEAKSSQYSFMLRGWEEKAEEEEALHGARSGVKDFSKAEGLVEAGLIRDVFNIRHDAEESAWHTSKVKNSHIRQFGAGDAQPTGQYLDQAQRQLPGHDRHPDYLDAGNFGEEEEVTGNMIEALSRKDKFNEYGNNIRISDRYNGQLNEVTAGMKEVYRALRKRDTNIDIDINAAALEERTEKAKVRWQQYVEMKEERERAMFGADEKPEEEDDDNNQMDFTKLYSRSVIVRQRWPWSKLVDIETDKTFYRNESSDYFQFEAPPQFEQEVDVPGSELKRHKPSDQASGRAGAAAPVGNRRRRGMMGSVTVGMDAKKDNDAENEKSDISQKVDDRTILRGNFNTELQQRREFLSAVHKKQRDEEFEKNQAPGGMLQTSDRRGKGARRAGGSASRVPRSQSIFNKQKGGAKSFLEEYMPPKNFHLSAQEAKEKWKMLSDLNSGKSQEKFDIGWHDANTLILRLRRFSELKKFAEMTEGDPHSPTRVQRHEADVFSSQVTALEASGRGPEIRDNSSLLRTTESQMMRMNGGEHSLTNSQSFANQTLMMESRGEPFVTSNTESSFRKARRAREEALQELDRTAALRRVVAHHKKRSFNEMREAVTNVSHYLDTYESTFFETEIIRRHLLEAAVMLRFCQSTTIRRRDAKAYIGLPPHLTIPHVLKGQDIEKLASADKDKDQRKWTKYTFTQNEFGNALRPDPADLFTLYVHNKTDRVQRGVPFDIKMREWHDNELKTMRWYKYGKMYSNTRKSKKAVTLLTDKNKGVLFHCPLRKVFDWKEQMDYSYYDIVHTDSKSTRNKNVFARPENKSIMPSDSDSDSNSDDNMISARKKKLKETLQTMANQSEGPAKTGKAARVYKTQAMEEHRALNIWADLNMTKRTDRPMAGKKPGGALGVMSGSTLYEESTQSTNTSARNPALSTTNVMPTKQVQNKTINSPAEHHGKLKNYFDPEKIKTRKFLDFFEGILLSNPVSPPFTVEKRTPQRPMYSPSDEKDSDALEFEEEMVQKDYGTYYDLIFDLYENPDHVPCLVALATFLLRHKLGRETIMVFVRILEVSSDKQYASNEDLACIVLSLCSMCCKYMSDYRISHILTEIVFLCPESSIVLGMAARLFHKLKLLDKAEELYIGALLLDPESSVSLRGYALLLTEAGNHAAAARYLTRVDEDAPHYATAKVEYGWIQELLGTPDEVLQLDYQAVLSAGLKTRESTLALAALGHFHHVRGEGARARVFYHRCLHQNPDNAYCLLLSSCLQATEVGKRNVMLPTTRTIVLPQGPLVDRSGGGVMKQALDVADEDEAIDAQFRRGLFFLQNPNSNRWVGLLAYAEFVANRLQDCKRAEDIFWEAARLSCKYSVWAVIALAHFYQYIWDDQDSARKVLLWAERKRTVPIVREDEDEDPNVDERDEDVFLRPEDKAKKKAQADQNAILLTLRSEDACLHATHAFVYYDQHNHKDCLAFLRKALECDKRSSTAYRLWGLLDWRQGKKHEAMHKFEKAHKYAPYNPYVLRVYSVACATMGLYSEAVEMMQRSVDLSGMGHPLACRAAGIMTYLYDSGKGAKERSLGYFQKAFDMSGGIDFEAGRLKAQVHMELGQFQKAVAMLLDVLPLKPCDSIALGSLALCMSALGHTAPEGQLKVNYAIKLKLMSEPQEILASKDPEELFEAATTFNLGHSFLQKTGKSKGAVLSKGWGILNNVAVEEPLDALEAHDNDVPPPVLYWFGMYLLQKGGKESRKVARTLFLRATQRQDYPPHLLSLHKLGWMAETNRDLRAAERYYAAGLQQDPVDPYSFLQLAKVVRDTRSYVHLLRTKRYGDPNSELEKATRMQQQALEKEAVSKQAGAGLKAKVKKVIKKKKKPGKTVPAPLSAEAQQVEAGVDDIALDAITLKQRNLLHDRVQRLLELRLDQMKNFLDGMLMPGAWCD